MSNGTAHEERAIARYRVLRELGTRSLRTHAAARDDGSLVVLHRFTRAPHADGNPVSAEQMALLLRDARCLAKNWHPNLARVKHVELQSDVLDIATELVDGITLEELLALAAARRLHPDEPVLSHAIVARIFLDVLAGLSALHGMRDGINAALGAFHGELCPTNVVVGKDGVARLVNVLRPRPVRALADSEALGYAAPETLAAEPDQDGRVDLYAAGVMLWEALSERRLYDEQIPSRVAQRQREEEVATPVARLADVAMRAIAFDPAVRFRSAHEMATTIRALAGTVAQGSMVAQLIGELAGERIRARRAELEPLASGRFSVPPSAPLHSRTQMRSAPALEEEPRSDRPTPDPAVIAPAPSSFGMLTPREFRVGPPSVPDLEASLEPRPKPARRATDAPPPPPQTTPALPVHALPLPGNATTSSLPPACVEDDDDLPGPRQSTPDDGYLEQLGADLAGPRDSSSVLDDLASEEDASAEAAAMAAAREVVLSTRATSPPDPLPAGARPLPIPASPPMPSFPAVDRLTAPLAAPPSLREPTTRTPFVVDLAPDVRISTEDLEAPKSRPALVAVIAGATVMLALIGGALLARSSDAPPSPAAIAATRPPPSVVEIAPQPPLDVVVAPPPSTAASTSASVEPPHATPPAMAAPRATPPKKRSVYDPANY